PSRPAPTSSRRTSPTVCGVCGAGPSRIGPSRDPPTAVPVGDLARRPGHPRRDRRRSHRPPVGASVSAGVVIDETWVELSDGWEAGIAQRERVISRSRTVDGETVWGQSFDARARNGETTHGPFAFAFDVIDEMAANPADFQRW